MSTVIGKQSAAQRRTEVAKASFLIFVILVISAVVMSLGPLPQSEEYHRFADVKELWGIPNGLNVLSNLAFLFAAVYGCTVMYSGNGVFVSPLEQPAYWVFFLSLVMVAFGSAYYHIDPTTGTLFWDRLPMTITFMSIVSIIISEKISERLGRSMLLPLCLLGVASVSWWSFTELHPDWNGDLRFYIVVQAAPMGLTPPVVYLYPARYSHAFYLYLCSALYFLAKIVEYFDHFVYQASFHVISGHSLKHLLAAAGVGTIPRMLTTRRVKKAD